MDCPDPLVCLAQVLSSSGAAIAAWQAFRASRLLKAASAISTDSPPPPADPEGAEQIPIDEAHDMVGRKLEKLATGWSPLNHRLLILSLLMLLFGSALSTYRAFFPLSPI